MKRFECSCILIKNKTKQKSENYHKPGVVVHIFNPSTPEAETEDLLNSRQAWFI